MAKAPEKKPAPKPVEKPVAVAPVASDGGYSMHPKFAKFKLGDNQK